MSELKIEYNDEMKPISATCTGCGEKMPPLPSDLQSPADAVVWLAEKYVEHRKLKHSQEERRRTPRSD